MKIIILFLVFVTVLKSQNFYPETRSFDIFGNQNYFIDRDSAYFNLNDEFILGWHWAKSNYLSKCLMVNQAHINWDSDFDFNVHHIPSNINDSTLLVISSWLEKGYHGHFAFDLQQSMKWDAALLKENGDDFVIRELDSERSVFGFANVIGERLDDPYDENYSRLILDNNITPTPQTVISNPNYPGLFEYIDGKLDFPFAINSYIPIIKRDSLNGITTVQNVFLKQNKKKANIQLTNHVKHNKGYQPSRKLIYSLRYVSF